MDTHREPASRLKAAAWFWLFPLIGVSVITGVGIFIFHAHDPGVGPMDEYRRVLSLIASVFTANAIGFAAAAFLCPPVRRQHASRLYILSMAVGVVCFPALQFVAWVVRALRGADDDSLLALSIGSCLLSGIISLVSLRGAIGLGLLGRISIDSVCIQCGYDLRGSREGRCPECGTERASRRDT